jgi:hypothetical protein
LEFVGNHEGRLEYRIHHPAINSSGAKTVSEHWNDKTKWPRGWVSAYHGGRWYGFWNTIATGWINISSKKGVGHQAGGGDGHYCAVDMEYARWFSRPQVLFEDGALHWVMYRIAFDSSKLKKARFVCEGTEYVVEDGGIVLLSCLMKPNFPPVEHTEERFQTWNPALEIRPFGCEDFTIPEIAKPNQKNWGPWENYYRRPS